MTKPKASRTAGPTTASEPPTASAPTKPKGWRLEAPIAPGQTPDRCMAQLAAGGIVGNARSLVIFGEATYGELSLTDCAQVLKDTAEGLNGGDLSAAVKMLASQAVALDAMFGELARRSALNMGQHLDPTERYMRLALKAQGQCRATLETLAAIKNPPVVFARQANINNGGQQQVNNGGQAAGGSNTPAPAPARKAPSVPNELLEDSTHGRTHLDTRATAAAGRANQRLEAVGAVNGTANG